MLCLHSFYFFIFRPCCTQMHHFHVFTKRKKIFCSLLVTYIFPLFNNITAFCFHDNNDTVDHCPLLSWRYKENLSFWKRQTDKEAKQHQKKERHIYFIYIYKKKSFKECDDGQERARRQRDPFVFFLLLILIMA